VEEAGCGGLGGGVFRPFGGAGDGDAIDPARTTGELLPLAPDASSKASRPAASWSGCARALCQVSRSPKSATPESPGTLRSWHSDDSVPSLLVVKCHRLAFRNSGAGGDFGQFQSGFEGSGWADIVCLPTWNEDLGAFAVRVLIQPNELCCV